MKGSKLLVVLLAVAVVSVDAVVFNLAGPPWERELAVLIMLSLGFSHGSLLVIWVNFGGQHWVLRIVLAAAGIAVLVWILGKSSPVGPDAWGMLCLIQATLLSLILFVLQRLCFVGSPHGRRRL